MENKETNSKVLKDRAGHYYGRLLALSVSHFDAVALPADRLQTQKCLVRSCVSFHLIIYFYTLHFYGCIFNWPAETKCRPTGTNSKTSRRDMMIYTGQRERERAPETMSGSGGDAAGVDAMHLRDNASGKLCKPPETTHPASPAAFILSLAYTLCIYVNG